jgi:type II secretory pathway component PulC
MSYSISFFSLISGLIEEANEGLYQAVEASKDQPVVFVTPRIDVQLRCIVTGVDGVVGVTLSNASENNYYGNKGESQLELTLKLKPR